MSRFTPPSLLACYAYSAGNFRSPAEINAAMTPYFEPGGVGLGNQIVAREAAGSVRHREAARLRRVQCGMPTMEAEQSARTRACHNNIERYRRLLRTRLTESERQFIEKRMSEERSELQRLAIALSNELS